MKRVVLVTVGILVAAIGVSVVYLLRNLDRIVEDAIERYGSQATGTPVRVDSVRIALREGRATVRGLEVGNPEGFDAPHAMAWDEVTIDIDPESFTSQPYVVDAVVIDAPRVIFEIDERGQANLRVLQQRLASGGGDAAEGGAAPEGAAEPRLRIRSFRFERGRVELRTAAVGGEDLDAELPPLQLEDLGGPQGATGSELGRSLLGAYTQQALRTVAQRELGRRARDLIDEKLGDEKGEAAKQVFDRLLDR